MLPGILVTKRRLIDCKANREMGVAPIKVRMMLFTHRNGANCWPRVALQALAAAILAAGNGLAQAPPGAGQVVTPASSAQKPGDTGVRAHTNIQIFIPNRGNDGAQPPGSGGVNAAGSRARQTPAANGPASPAQPH
jgi:hypothetical protein